MAFRSLTMMRFPWTFRFPEVESLEAKIQPNFREAILSMLLRTTFVITLCLVVLTACGINSVTKAEIEAIKPGNKITYRHQKDGKSWFYADKVTRVEGDMVYYNASKNESTKGSDTKLDEFDTTRELSVKKADLLKFETEQPPDEKKIIWIE